MKRLMSLVVAVLLATPVSVFASEVVAENTTEASMTEDEIVVEEVLFNAENSEVFQDKENYLLMKANDFVEEGRFDEAKVVAEYILNKMNADSEAAKDLLALAEENIDVTNETILSTTQVE